MTEAVILSAAAAVGGFCLRWIAEKSAEVLFEHRACKWLIPENDRRSYVERMAERLDTLEQEHVQLVALTERVIQERDDYARKYLQLQADARVILRANLK